MSRKNCLKTLIFSTLQHFSIGLIVTYFGNLGYKEHDLLNYQYFESQKNDINKLVYLRNSVAHGSQKEPIEFHDYVKIEKSMTTLMEEIIKYLYQYCYEQKFLK